MKIGILQCDSVRETLREQGFEDYSEMFIERFRRVDPALEFRVYRCMDNEIPSSVDECDGYVSTGSRFSVLDEEVWIRRLEAFVVALVEARVPYVGICFGHQLLAKALGGKVVRADVGWGVGVSENRIEAPQWWMGEEPLDEVNLVVSHQDQVVKLPEQMKTIGGSEFCPIYFCVVDDHALSIQGHPEFSRDYSRALMEMRRGLIPAKVIDDGIKSLELRVDDEETFRWMVRFFRESAARSGRQLQERRVG
ncbi:MAG: GMP synthase [Proteobacteria bacterium]|nr:MAG: GMP synthase [Pseudomonadota bacterium]